MAAHLDTQVAAFRSRPLDAGPYTFAWVDALTVKVRVVLPPSAPAVAYSGTAPREDENRTGEVSAALTVQDSEKSPTSEPERSAVGGMGACQLPPLALGPRSTPISAPFSDERDGRAGWWCATAASQPRRDRVAGCANRP
jgi:hypothetical protein